MTFLRAVALAAGVGLFACAQGHTDIANSWTSPSYAQGTVPRRVLVVALASNLDLRSSVEETLAAKLNAEGKVQAAPGEQYLPPRKPRTAAMVQDAATRNGYDGVLVVRFQGLQPTNFVPSGATRFQEYFDMYGPIVYNTTEITRPPPSSSNKAVTFDRGQTSLFDLRQDGQLVWTATSDTLQTSPSVQREVPRFVEAVVKRLDRDVLT